MEGFSRRTGIVKVVDDCHCIWIVAVRCREGTEEFVHSLQDRQEILVVVRFEAFDCGIKKIIIPSIKQTEDLIYPVIVNVFVAMIFSFGGKKSIRSLLPHCQMPRCR